MMTRRTIMTLAGATPLLLMPPLLGGWLARAQSAPSAVDFVKSTSDGLVAIVNSDDMPQEKRRRLSDVVASSVDDQDIGRFCLGRFWDRATPEQREQYMAVFHELLVTKIAAHLGDYRGVRVTMGPEHASDNTEIVITTVERPGTPAYHVEWVVGTTAGGLKIIDLVAQGTSLRLTQSNDVASYLARHQYSINELIEGMRQLVASTQ